MKPRQLWLEQLDERWCASVSSVALTETMEKPEPVAEQASTVAEVMPMEMPTEQQPKAETTHEKKETDTHKKAKEEKELLSVDLAALHLHGLVGVAVSQMPHSTNESAAMDMPKHTKDMSAKKMPEMVTATHNPVGMGMAMLPHLAMIVGLANEDETEHIAVEIAHDEPTPEPAHKTRAQESHSQPNTTAWASYAQNPFFTPSATTEAVTETVEDTLVEVQETSDQTADFFKTELTPPTLRVRRFLGWCSATLGLLWGVWMLKQKNRTGAEVC